MGICPGGRRISLRGSLLFGWNNNNNRGGGPSRRSSIASSSAAVRSAIMDDAAIKDGGGGGTNNGDGSRSGAPAVSEASNGRSNPKKEQRWQQQREGWSRRQKCDGWSDLGSRAGTAASDDASKATTPKKRGPNFVTSLRSSIVWKKSDSGGAHRTGRRAEEDDDADDESGEEGDDDDRQDRLETELFAPADARFAAVVRESGELMTSVNKSTIAMGLDAPFRPANEVSSVPCSMYLCVNPDRSLILLVFSSRVRRFLR
jgi:hypothetical protein